MEDQSGMEGESHILLKTGSDACHRGQGSGGNGSQSGLANSRELLDNADSANHFQHTTFCAYIFTSQFHLTV